MVWKVVYYGRTNSRKQPNTTSAICEEYSEGDFVEVFDYAEQGSSKWIRIRGHGRNDLGKRRKDAWIMAVDSFSGMDLVTRCSNKESKLAREYWGQAPRREFDRTPARESPVEPASDGAGPAPQVVPEVTSDPDQPATDDVALPTNHIDSSMFKQAADSKPVDLMEEKMKELLESEAKLREVRLQNLPKASTPELSTTENPVPDGSRDDWKRGTKIAVWSQGDLTWYNGVVAGIEEEGGLFEKLEVHFKKSGQRHKKLIPRYSNYLKKRQSNSAVVSPEPSTRSKPRAEPSTADNAPQSSDTPSNPNGVREGWTEHFDKSRNRFYYYNKKERVTMWDSDALKLGIISEIKKRPRPKSEL